ncbi:MAG: hypothetical protein ACWA41_09455 [Putridiphycobacter sp.]
MNRILEKFWWAVAIITLVAVIYFSFVQGFDKWKFYFAVPVLAVIMALVRKFMSKKLDRSKATKNQ